MRTLRWVQIAEGLKLEMDLGAVMSLVQSKVCAWSEAGAVVHGVLQKELD